jgi:hypothetical protein
LENERHAFSIEPDQARRHLELLAQAGAVLSRSLDLQATLQGIASILVPEIAD